MSTVSYSGYQGTVTANSTDMDISNWNADVEQGDFDATTTADGGWDNSGYAIKKVSGSFDFFFNSSKNPVSAPQSMFSRTDVPLVLTLGGSTKTLTGNAQIQKLSIKNEVKGGVTMTATFKSQGAWTGPA